MGFFKSISKYGLIPAVFGGNLVTKVLEKATGKKYGRMTLEKAASTKTGKFFGLATIGAASALGVAVAGVPATIAASKRLIPKTTLGKTSALFLGSAAIVSPTLTKTIIEAPFAVVKGGKKVGSAIETLPTGIKDTAKILGVAGLVVAGAGAAALTIPVIAGVAGKVFDRDKEEKQLVVEIPEEQFLLEKELGKEETPILPETQIVTPTKKPSKRRRATKKQNINQSVKVSVNVGNRRYLNNILITR